MKKNAFTLIELLGVITVLGLLTLIAVPTIEKSIKNSKQKLYEVQVSNIKSGLKKWAANNLFFLPDNEGEVITITLYQLKQGSYTEKDILNPLNDELFPNDMLLTITKENNGFEYAVLTNTGTQTGTNVVNPDAPLLLLNGGPTQYVEVFDTYTDLGITAIDSEGNLIDPSNVTITISGSGSSINTSSFGSYTVKYQVTDPDNGYKTTAIRTVIVSDKTKPSLSVPSNVTLSPTKVLAFNARTGASATDNYDGDLTSQIEITGNLSILPGTYYLAYKVTDSSGNISTGKRIISVIEVPLYTDASGASIPELTTGMIPVVYDGTNWIKANITQEWYDYNAKEWANAVTVTSTNRAQYESDEWIGEIIPISDINTMWVWIPRYKYAIPTGTGARSINIVFETKDTTKSTGNAIDTNYRTHPVFTFGTIEVSGIWIGKFETTGTTDSLTILPNTASLRTQSVKEMYDSSRTMQNNTTYGTGNDSNIHMVKNSEWGAVAYLSHSKYGINSEIYKNNSSDYITGRSGGNAGGSQVTVNGNEHINTGFYTYDGKCATTTTLAPGITSECTTIDTNLVDKTLAYKASTTGNIYGIYDMSGGALEYTISMYRPTDSTSVTDLSGFGATTTVGSLPASEYWDRYTATTAATACSGICYGNALSETSNWYSDWAFFAFDSAPWSVRGGNYGNLANAGIFNFDYGNGASSSGTLSFRLAQLKP